MNRRRSSNLHFIKSFFQLFLSPYNPSLDGAHPFKLLSLLSESSSSMLILPRSFADLRRLIVEMPCNEKEEESGTNFVYSFDFCNKCFVKLKQKIDFWKLSDKLNAYCRYNNFKTKYYSIYSSVNKNIDVFFVPRNWHYFYHC